MDITKYAFVQVENQKYENIDLSLDNKYFSNLRIHQLRVSAGRSVSLIALTSNPLPAGLWSSDSSFVVWLATDLFDAWSGKSPDSLESCRFQRRRVVGELRSRLCRNSQRTVKRTSCSRSIPHAPDECLFGALWKFPVQKTTCENRTGENKTIQTDSFRSR